MRLIAAALAALFFTLTPAMAQDGHEPILTTQDGADVVMCDPSAPVTFDEYLSYTCPHCGHFEAEAEPSIEKMVRDGRLRVRLISAVRDPLDTAEAMLVRCAAPDRALALHRAFFARQEELYNAARRTPDFYTEVPKIGPADLAAVVKATAIPAIAKDAGMNDAAIADCLNDSAALATVRDAAMAAWDKIDGTPSFAINGTMLEKNDWPSVQARITAALSKK